MPIKSVSPWIYCHGWRRVSVSRGLDFTYLGPHNEVVKKLATLNSPCPLLEKETFQNLKTKQNYKVYINIRWQSPDFQKQENANGAGCQVSFPTNAIMSTLPASFTLRFKQRFPFFMNIKYTNVF